jgi:hypothetical protein
MALADDVRERWAKLTVWSRRVAKEVTLLPDTLERLRDGAVNFQVVGKRLEESSSALEDVTRLYTKTLGDVVKRSSDAADAVRAQLDTVNQRGTPSDVLSSTVAELRRQLTALADLNPFWPGPGGSSTGGPRTGGSGGSRGSNRPPS